MWHYNPKSEEEEEVYVYLCCVISFFFSRGDIIWLYFTLGDRFVLAFRLVLVQPI